MTLVLIAVDETEDSVRAATVAQDLFGDDADYLALSVAEVRLDPATMTWWAPAWSVGYPVAYGAVWPYRRLKGDRTPGERAKDTAEMVVAEAGLSESDAVTALGDPAEAIIRTAEAREADVIVVASHDRGWLSRLVQPSVTNAVVKRSPVPVLVVQ